MVSYLDGFPSNSELWVFSSATFLLDALLWRTAMVRNGPISLFLILVVLFGGFPSATATPPVKIVSGIVTNVVSALVKWLWSLKSTPKTAVASRSMMKFESGYTVETVFDGSKLGIEPYSVELSPDGELLLLDSENSNIYRISMPISRYSRPKIVAGSPEGITGHVDGKLREARMNHPKGITVDDRGNIYIADTMNMAIRKISDAGVTTIAGGKRGRGGGHVDGPSEDARFSDDFDLIYLKTSCSLLIIDRGNQAIREIPLNHDDCSENDNGSFHLGIAVLVAAGFFGYMLALLQRRVQTMFSSGRDDLRTPIQRVPVMAPYQKPPKSVRPPLIPNEYELEKPEEGLLGSLGKLSLNTGSFVTEIFGGIFSGFRRKPKHYQFQQQYYNPVNKHSHYQFQEQYYNPVNKHSNAWSMQESSVIPNEPPSIESRYPTPRKTDPLMTKELEKNHHLKQNQAYYNGWNDGEYHQQQRQQLLNPQQQQHYHMQCSSNPKTHYEQSCETNEIVFGEVQEQDGWREAMVIKAVDYGDSAYSLHNIRPRYNYMGY